MYKLRGSCSGGHLEYDSPDRENILQPFNGYDYPVGTGNWLLDNGQFIGHVNDRVVGDSRYIFWPKKGVCKIPSPWQFKREDHNSKEHQAFGCAYLGLEMLNED